MSKRIYTFEVEIDDTGIHERYDDGTCDHKASVSCKDSISRNLDLAGRTMARDMMSATSKFSPAEKATFEESYSEDEWNELLDRPARKGVAEWNARQARTGLMASKMAPYYDGATA